MDDILTKQSGKELLKKALEQWRKDGLWDTVSDSHHRMSTKTAGDDEGDVLANMEKDPVINLFMTALAHQTNLLKELVAGLKDNLISEFVRKTVPYALTRPVPAVTVMQAKLSMGDVSSITVDESVDIVLEKSSKSKMKYKDVEKFHFLPIFKTQIFNATVQSVRCVGDGTFAVTIAGPQPIGDLSGLSLYFPQLSLESIRISVNGKTLPVCSLREFDRMPLCKVFDSQHSVFNRSLLYGTPESWADTIAPFASHLFYVGSTDTCILEKQVTLEIELVGMDQTSLESENVLLNCFPIVNVIKGETSLSQDEPIKCIAAEKGMDWSSNGPNGVQHSHVFLNLLAPDNREYDRDNITLRRFGAERYHVGELVAQTRALTHRYASDFHAFREFADGDFDDKMNNLTMLLNEIDQIVGPYNPSYSGVYVMLNKRNFGNYGDYGRIRVSYLLTDGSKGNNIPSSCTMSLPPDLNHKESHILMPTFGGKDEVIDAESLKTLSLYYKLSNDRLITRADIKSFCKKELMLSHSISFQQISAIDFNAALGENGYQMTIRILIDVKQGSTITEELAQSISSELQQKIRIRTSDFVDYKVSVEIV